MLPNSVSCGIFQWSLIVYVAPIETWNYFIKLSSVDSIMLSDIVIDFKYIYSYIGALNVYIDQYSIF